jgi:thaumarchaeosortase
VSSLSTPANQKTAYYTSILLKVLPPLAFAIPLAVLYLLNPFDGSLNVTVQASFELMWKGRTFQLFFIWLVALELILSWEKIASKICLKNKPQLIAYIAALLLPTVYLVLAFSGLNSAIAAGSSQIGVAFANSMPLAAEYLVFTAIFLLIAFLSFGKKGLTDFLLPALFLLLVGLLYTIDNVFPYGEFTPFQLLVPTTSSLAASVLQWMGYGVVPGVETATGMPTLQVSGAGGSATFAIAWPCAGIESLLIFTAVALLFLKRMNINWKAKVGFFAVGAAVTYFINIIRITQIFVLGMQYGEYSAQVNDFHYYYGPLYAMTWIVCYPLIVIAVTMAWQKFRKPQPAQLNPA